MNVIKKPFKKFLKILGPGFVTGAADDDPSGIATCSQTGAQFGFAQLWTAFFMLPLMIAIQEACARISIKNGHGLAHVIKYNYNKKILYFIVLLLLIANIINIGADLGAMAAASVLIIPVNIDLMVIFFAFIILTSQVFFGYKKYSKLLKWLCLFLLAYPITIFVVNAPIMEVIQSTFIPHIEFNYQFLFLITGLFGTTISPYMFFWQASQEVEELHTKHLINRAGETKINKKYLLKIRLDTILGMTFSQITTWSIIVVAGTVLHPNHIENITNAADVAKMLEPLVHNFPHAGLLAKIIFAVGLIGLGLLAIPVLGGSASYAICEALGFAHGMNRKFKTAKCFYGIMIVATIIGILINFLDINPIVMLVYAAVINGIIAVPLIFMIALIASNEKIMGKYKSGLLSNFFVWLTFFGMLASAIGLFLSMGK